MVGNNVLCHVDAMYVDTRHEELPKNQVSKFAQNHLKSGYSQSKSQSDRRLSANNRGINHQLVITPIITA